ncbi:anti-sigma factor family protein [Solitalea lacus]|uniref:anti-sigma factor family protein n=1 Tax=Solitalea lacus TaxID=2911172 RepID=UPI001EDAD04F|nr:hypothetical protein [Solitalea lacus]UKJ08109.1 hypothetical protein L2B55_02825 [Solitalea lacus]
MNRITEEQLWDLADGLIQEPQAGELMRYIEEHPVLKKKLDEIKALNASLASIPLEAPSANFTAKVMAQWRTETSPSALKTLVNRKIIYGIAAVFGVLIISLLIYTIGSTTPEPSAQYMAKSEQVQEVVNSQIDSFLGNKTFWFSFLMIDAVLLLVFIDKWISGKRLKNELA